MRVLRALCDLCAKSCVTPVTRPAKGFENYNRSWMSEPLWTPPVERVRRANLLRFGVQVKERWRSWMNLDYAQLYEWSISEPAEFWQSVWDFGGIRASLRGGPA